MGNIKILFFNQNKNERINKATSKMLPEHTHTVTLQFSGSAQQNCVCNAANCNIIYFYTYIPAALLQETTTVLPACCTQGTHTHCISLISLSPHSLIPILRIHIGITDTHSLFLLHSTNLQLFLLVANYLKQIKVHHYFYWYHRTFLH